MALPIHPYIYIPLSLPTFAQVSESLQDTSDPAAPDAGNQHGDAVDITAADTLPVSGWKNAHICTGAVIRVHMFCAIEIDGCCYCIYIYFWQQWLDSHIQGYPWRTCPTRASTEPGNSQDNGSSQENWGRAFPMTAFLNPNPLRPQCCCYIFFKAIWRWLVVHPQLVNAHDAYTTHITGLNPIYLI